MQRIKTRKLKRKQKKQLAFLTFIILAAGIVAIMLLTPLFDITEISVTGNSVVREEDIIRSGGIVKGINIFSVSTRKASRAIEKMGYIDSAKLYRRLPGKIEIEVVEAAGVGCISAGSSYIIITADGRAIDRVDNVSTLLRDKVKDNGNEESENKEEALSDKNETTGNNDTIGVPVITGLTNVRYKIGSKITCDDPGRLEALVKCLKAFSKGGYVFKMTEIDISSIADIAFLYNKGKLKVYVGSTDKLDYKMECFGPILEQIEEDPSGYIDLERMTYRKKEE